MICKRFDKYRLMYEEAIILLKQFNSETESIFSPASLEEFQARVMRGEQIQDVPFSKAKEQYTEFLLPKILVEATDLNTMRRLMDWISQKVKISERV